jgi:hypothetical protein
MEKKYKVKVISILRDNTHLNKDEYPKALK